MEPEPAPELVPELEPELVPELEPELDPELVPELEPEPELLAPQLAGSVMGETEQSRIAPYAFSQKPLIPPLGGQNAQGVFCPCGPLSWLLAHVPHVEYVVHAGKLVGDVAVIDVEGP